MSLNTLSYTVNDQGVILDVSESWDSLCKNNNSDTLKQNILGQYIWKYFNVEPLIVLYKKLFDAVLKTEHEASLRFRCDNHEVMRFMEMLISSVDGNLLVKSRMIKELPRKQLLSRLILYMGVEHGKIMCSHCNRIYIIGKKEWMEIDVALTKGYVNGNLNVKFDICPDCISQIDSLIKSF